METARLLHQCGGIGAKASPLLRIAGKECGCNERTKTDMAEEEFMRVTVHTMMTACAYYAGGFIWGSKENEDYTPELIKLKEMILAYATLNR